MMGMPGPAPAALKSFMSPELASTKGCRAKIQPKCSAFPLYHPCLSLCIPNPCQGQGAGPDSKPSCSHCFSFLKSHHRDKAFLKGNL